MLSAIRARADELPHDYGDPVFFSAGGYEYHYVLECGPGRVVNTEAAAQAFGMFACLRCWR